MVTYPQTTIMSLCSGVGGIELGLKLVIPNARTVMYCERELFACKILVKRMEEGFLDEAPIWTDIITFDGKPWRGKVDIITSGFPCQPWSVAGQRKGTEDERWIWEDIFRVICEVRPGYVFLENVPGLVAGGGLQIVLGDLSKAGYDAEWMSLSAAEVGAPHKRERIWILAYDDSFRFGREDIHLRQRGQNETKGEPFRDGEVVGDTIGNGHQEGCEAPVGEVGKGEEGRVCEPEGAGDVADPSGRDSGRRPNAGGVTDEGGEASEDGGEGLQAREQMAFSDNPEQGGQDVADAVGNAEGSAHGKRGNKRGADDKSQNRDSMGNDIGDSGKTRRGGKIPNSKHNGLEGAECEIMEGEGEGGQDPPPSGPSWWSAEPRLGRVANGVPNRVDRLRACGNAVVPLVAATAWRILKSRIDSL